MSERRLGAKLIDRKVSFIFFLFNLFHFHQVIQDYKINEIKNEILLTSQRKEMIDSSLDIKKEQNENKNERHQDSSKVSFGNFLNLNIEKEEIEMSFW